MSSLLILTPLKLLKNLTSLSKLASSKQITTTALFSLITIMKKTLGIKNVNILDYTCNDYHGAIEEGVGYGGRTRKNKYKRNACIRR